MSKELTRPWTSSLTSSRKTYSSRCRVKRRCTTCKFIILFPSLCADDRCRVYLRGSLKIHVPLNLVVAYVQEDMDVVKTFASLKSISLQYKIVQDCIEGQKVLYEGTSANKTTVAQSTSLLLLGDAKFTDLLSNEPLPPILDAHLDMQRCLHHDFDLMCPIPSKSRDNLDYPVFVEFTLVAFCAREDSLNPEQEYLYLGPPMKVPLLPMSSSYENMIVAAAKPPYLLRSDLEYLKLYLEECNEIELFLADADLADLPKHLQVELVL